MDKYEIRKANTLTRDGKSIVSISVHKNDKLVCAFPCYDDVFADTTESALGTLLADFADQIDLGSADI